MLILENEQEILSSGKKDMLTCQSVHKDVKFKQYLSFLEHFGTDRALMHQKNLNWAEKYWT